jgi:hypothetical protein
MSYRGSGWACTTAAALAARTPDPMPAVSHSRIGVGATYLYNLPQHADIDTRVTHECSAPSMDYALQGHVWWPFNLTSPQPSLHGRPMPSLLSNTEMRFPTSHSPGNGRSLVCRAPGKASLAVVQGGLSAAKEGPAAVSGCCHRWPLKPDSRSRFLCPVVSRVTLEIFGLQVPSRPFPRHRALLLPLVDGCGR